MKNSETRQSIILHVIARFFVVLFQVATFTIKSEYSRWFEIASGMLIWLNLFVIGYSALSLLNVL